ncbi:MAG: prepilin peptidase [Desulfitobacteriia bacterium]|jgi:leader peptidase (prepilin peptidase)/N-methyltransferase
MQLFYPVLYGILGLVSGSFLNVLIYRIPRGESIIKPRSHCPHCNHKLRAWELVPVLSFLLLGRKCRKCSTKISWRYPVVEILTALMFILIYLFRTTENIVGLFCNLVLVSILIALSFIDIETLRLPDSLVILVAAMAILNILGTKEPGFGKGLVGAIAAGGIFFLIHYFYPQGMGFGDVKLVAALGLYLGVLGIFLTIFMASLLGILFGGVWLLVLKKSPRDPIPFGPFLAAGAVIVLLFFQPLTALF